MIVVSLKTTFRKRARTVAAVPSNSLPGPRKSHTTVLPTPAFTLVELTVVLTLMFTFVATAALQLDGFSASGRLHSTARQIASFHTLARIEAISSGRPRLLGYEVEGHRCRIREPHYDGFHWAWSEGALFHLTTRVRLVRLLIADRELTSQGQEPWTVRINSDGTSSNYAFVLAIGERSLALIMDGVTGSGRIVKGVDPDTTDLASLIGSEYER